MNRSRARRSRAACLAALSCVAGSLALLHTPVSRACPEHERIAEPPAELRRQDHVWELALPHSATHDLQLGADLAQQLPATIQDSLRRNSATIALMDEIGRKQGVVVVGIGERSGLLIVPKGRSPYPALLQLKASRPAAWPANWTDIWLTAQRLPEPERREYLAQLDLLLPGALERRADHRYGKLVASECKNGSHEKFLMLALPGGRVAFLSYAGFLGYDPRSPSSVSAHAASLRELQRWRLERHDPFTVSLRSARDTYLHWGGRDHFELDAGATRVETAPVFQNNRERFFLWVNGDGTVTLKLPNNRVSISVAEWELDRQGLDVNCHYYGYRQDPSPRKLPVSLSLGTRS